MQRTRKYFLRIVSTLAIAYLLLLIPDAPPSSKTSPGKQPFVWNQDSLWQALENNFLVAKQQQPDNIQRSIRIQMNRLQVALLHLQHNKVSPGDAILSSITQQYFLTAPLVAAQPVFRDSFLYFYQEIRNAVKQQSVRWNMSEVATRNSLYQLLYGMRAATEEVLLQTEAMPFDAVAKGKAESVATPSASLLGIKVHSGDLLLSRGGAPVSALISRGNDYPANFSHVALLYVDAATNKPWLIEAHIEKGVAIADAETYLQDKKLRCMVLRLSNHVRALQKDPMLPHKAALLAYQKTQQTHIPYDFKMNFYDSSAMFCSEVGSFAYQQKGIQLWQGISTISSPGIINWLGAFGVENFVTQMPGDLEYDPQLSVVAEWRNPETLMKDHIDNAVMDALIRKADAGATIGYNHWMLPIARVIKGWSWLQNKFNQPGVIPEGMSATQGLKNEYFVQQYEQLSKSTSLAALQFEKEKGYRPPYWQLVTLAEQASQ